MITLTYFGKLECTDISDKQALIQSLEYMFQKTDAQHGCILTFLHKEEIVRALGDFIADVRDNGAYIRVIGDGHRIVDIFPLEYFGNMGVSIQKTFQGYRFDYVNIIGNERVCGVNSKVVSECMRRFTYLT